MAKDNKIYLPSSGGGLVNYSEEPKTKLEINPYVVLGIIAVIVIVEIWLYKLG